MASNQEIVRLDLGCVCKEVQAALHCPVSALPLPTYLCHCNSCTSASGQLCATVATVPTGGKLETNNRAQSYRTSDAMERFFCENCGTTVYEEASDMAPGRLFLVSSTFAASEVEVGGRVIAVTTPGQQIFVGETKDGGRRDWSASTLAQQGRIQEPTEENVRGKPTPKAAETENVSGRCQCGGVQFSVAHPATDRYHAFICACTSCRRATGMEFPAWAVIPDGSLNMRNMKKLKQYHSPESSSRGFCSGCGTCISFITEKMPGATLVPVRMLNDGSSTCGNHGQEILDWRTDSILHALEKQTRQLVGDLERRLRESGYQAT